MNDMPDPLGAMCGHCGYKTWFSLQASTEGVPEDGHNFEAGIYVCGGCGKPSFVTRSYYALTNEYPTWHLHSPLPAPCAQEWRNLPDGIRQDHREAWDCFNLGQHKAAMLMARTALQRACRKLGAKRGRLADEIQDLEQQGKITDDLRKLADEVRLLGNDVAHPPEEVNEVDRDEAEELLLYLDNFLNTTVVLPEKVRLRIAERDAKK